MQTHLILLAVALIGGLMLSRLTKKLNLPAVTAYLVAGLAIGPFCLGALKISGLGFQSLEQVEGMSILTQTALGFIAFTIGNEFRLSQLKATGAKAITIGIFPDLPREKYQVLKNSSLDGAKALLLDHTRLAEAKSLAENIYCVQFASIPDFLIRMQAAKFLPHTDLRRFPSFSQG